MLEQFLHKAVLLLQLFGDPPSGVLQPGGPAANQRLRLLYLAGAAWLVRAEPPDGEAEMVGDQQADVVFHGEQHRVDGDRGALLQKNPADLLGGEGFLLHLALPGVGNLQQSVFDSEAGPITIEM